MEKSSNPAVAVAKVAGTIPAARAHRRRRSDAGVAFLFLLPNILGFVLFSVVPIVATFALSLFDWPLIRPPSFAGLANYITLFTKDTVFGQVVLNTLYYVAVYVALNLIVSLTFASWIAKNARGYALFRAALFISTMVPPVAIALIWQWIYNPVFGLLNAVLAAIGIQGPNWTGNTNWGMISLILMSVWELFGYNMFIFIAGIQGIPEQLYEAARLDGAGRWQKFWYITLPMLSPIIFFGTTLTLITSFQTFDQVFVLTNGGPGNATTILGLYIYNNAFRFFRMGYGATVSVVMFAMILAVTLIQFALQRKWVYYETER